MHRFVARLALVVFFAGCHREAAPPQPPPQPPPQSAQPAQQSHVTVGVLQHASSIPIIVAKTSGLFEKHGITVDLQTLTPTEHMPALLTGKVNALSPSSFPIIMSAAQQHPGTIAAYLTGGESTNGDIIYGLIVRPNSQYQTLAELKGKTIASASKFTTINLRNVLRAHFRDTNNATQIADITDKALLLDGVLKGKFDAAVLDQPTLASALARGGVRLIEPNFRARYITDPYWSGSGIAARTWTRQSPDAFHRYLDAIDDALRLIKADPLAARRSFLTYFKITDVQPQDLGMYVYPGARFAPPDAFVNDLVATLRESKILDAPDVDHELFHID